jgi:hypothetical protein
MIGILLKFRRGVAPAKKNHIPHSHVPRSEKITSEAGGYELSEAPVWLESLGRLFAKRTPRPKVAGLEKDLGIYEPSRFTPRG